MNARALSVSATASDFLSLTKPRPSSLVLVTTAGGMWLSPSGLSPARQIASLLAVAGLVGGANALNCFLEGDVDRVMGREPNRSLSFGPDGPPGRPLCWCFLAWGLRPPPVFDT